MAGRAVRAAAAAIAACAAAGAAAAGEAEAARWYVQVDNDAFYGTDRWYTSGVRIARVAQRGGHALEWGLLQEIYTPEAKRINPIDRPPAARLLATFARHDRDERAWRTLEVDAGVAGPNALGRQAQDLVHRVFPAPHEDWSQQRPNRVDVQAVYADSRTLPLLEEDWERLKANYGAVLGSQLTYAHAGLEWRVGRGAATTMSSPVLRFAATPPLAAGDSREPGWSAFVAADARDVIRNRLLERRADSPLPPLQDRRWVGRFSVGVDWIHRCGTVSLAMVIDTREFEGQRRNQGFGSLVLELPF
ncbi:MAG TPA: lipid A deacylase LpxR family protein [Usitatibacter sp.]|nr:lipid A deacylase LpxR family protein [Usitatibacter sp.]